MIRIVSITTTLILHEGKTCVSLTVRLDHVDNVLTADWMMYVVLECRNGPDVHTFCWLELEFAGLVVRWIDREGVKADNWEG